MNNLVLPLFLTLLSLSCASQTNSTQTKEATRPNCDPYIHERLQFYFGRNEVEPAQVINKTEKYPGAWDSRTQKITIGNHTVEWIDRVDKRNSKSSVGINGDLIALKDKQSVNAVDGSKNMGMNVVGVWDQIKLYKLYDQEIIAITMSPRTCTGLMCSVGAQLYYDVKTKQETFFGTYQTNFREAKLYRFANGEANYIVSTNFDGDPHGGSTSAVTYELYKLGPRGDIQIQKNPAGVNYFIKHTMFPETESKPDQIEQNWIEDIFK